jgi:transcriptional regulator with XRE-family HTH domain
MGTTSNDRVISLLKTLKIDEVEASRRVGKHSATLYRITNKDHEPTKTTLKIIADKLGASYDWLLTGRGEMFSTDSFGQDAMNPWKDALVSQIKEENSRLQKEVERLWQMISFHTSGTKPNFLKVIEFPGSYDDSEHSMALTGTDY